MQNDAKAKVDYTDTHDMLVNFWQKDTYQAESMKRFDVVKRMKEREDRLVQWVNENPKERNEYLQALTDIEEYYRFVRDNQFEEQYRAINAIINWPVELSNNIYELHELFTLMLSDKVSKRKVKKEAKRISKRLPEIFQNFHPDIDSRLYSDALLNLTKFMPDTIGELILKEIKDQEYPEFFIPYIIELFYDQSIFTSQERMKQFLSKPNLDSLVYDPLFMMQFSLEIYSATLGDTMAPHRHKLSMAYKTINKGYLEMDSDKTFYPDANSTMRLSYGKVIGYNPLDGVVMHPNTYLRGVMEKGNSNVDVFKVSSKLKELYANKDYANYADSIGVPICFLTDNDITNGNSGSPVLNANGNLVGVAFDGNQEAMACDFMFEPHMQRTISVDIRYVLFVIDKYANAKRLIDEMTLITD